jgi:hypothetical protein
MDGALRLLLSEGGPVLRYLAAAELAPPEVQPDRRQLELDLLGTPEVQTWLDNLSLASSPRIRANTIHGASDACFENAMGKLVQFGMRAGMSELDERAEPFRRWLAEFPGGEKYLFGPFYTTIVASFLAMAGYRDKAILGALRDRLFSTYNFCRQGKYGIYADKTGYRRVPEIWTDVPLVDPALYPGDDWYLPWIHDVNGFAVLLTASPDGMPVSEMVDTVVRYVLNPEYQALRDGYGIVTDGKGRYWAMGWSVHLPGLPGCPRVTSQAGLVGRLATMSAFEAAREHAWFRDGLAYLESFRTPRGTYVFPREILPEKKTSYWVGGTHCGLGENRRTRNWLELESTYWALRCRRSYANR